MNNLFKKLKTNKDLTSVSLDDGDEGLTLVGIVRNVSEDYSVMRVIDEDGDWAGFACLPLEIVEKVEIGGPYEKRLSKMSSLDEAADFSGNDMINMDLFDILYFSSSKKEVLTLRVEFSDSVEEITGICDSLDEGGLICFHELAPDTGTHVWFDVELIRCVFFQSCRERNALRLQDNESV